MIRHIVFFTAKNTEHYEAVYEGLSILRANPHSLKLEIGRNLKTDTITQESVDFVVYGEFESEEALAAYKAHPTYQESISVVRPLREMRIAADYVSE